MQLRTLRASLFPGTALVVALVSACTADGPSLWTSGAQTGGTGSSDDPECAALEKCCTELKTTPSAQGASCNGSVPTEEMLCQDALEAFQATGSCTDITVAASGTGSATADAGAAAAGTTAAYGCYSAKYNNCFIFHNFMEPATQCSISQGTANGTTCPTAGLVGCCIPPHVPAPDESTEMCYYTGDDGQPTAPVVMGFCGSDTTFSTTP